jgi:diacylglycerol kinase family enzyme
MTRDAEQRMPAFINPEARTADDAREALEAEGGFDIHVVDPNSLAERIRECIARGVPRVAVAGGDGTLSTAAQALLGSETALAVIPGGTLNHFAAEHHIPTDRREAAKVALHGTVGSADVATVNHRVFLNTSSVGTYVGLVRRRERMERWLGYAVGGAVAAIQSVLSTPAFRIVLQVENRSVEYRTPLLFVGVHERELKLPTLGARVDGGERGLHLLVVRGRRRGGLLALGLSAAARGVESVAKTPALDSYIVDEFRVFLRRTGPVAVDGEIVTLETPLRYRMLHGGLRVIVPGG